MIVCSAEGRRIFLSSDCIMKLHIMKKVRSLQEFPGLEKRRYILLTLALLLVSASAPRLVYQKAVVCVILSMG